MLTIELEHGIPHRKQEHKERVPMKRNPTEQIKKQPAKAVLADRPRRAQSLPGGLGPLRRMIKLIGAILLHPTFLSLLPRGLPRLPIGDACLEIHVDTGSQPDAFLLEVLHEFQRRHHGVSGAISIPSARHG